MTDKELQRKLNKLAKLADELDEEARVRWDAGFLFYEAEGTFYIMSGDAHTDTASLSDRQAYVEFKSNVFCRMGSGAW